LHSALLALLVGLTASLPAGAAGIADSWAGTYWGEPADALLAHFGARATLLPYAVDFGDSYAKIVLRNVTVGGFRLVAFFQMDKATGGLKRIQLERSRHGVTLAAFRAVLGALEATYGLPDAMCGVRPGPASGYRAAAERIWRRDGAIIRAIFRDTTIAAFEGCLAGDDSAAPCGLTGQLLVRISPPWADAASCPAPPSAREQ
jgi:hypothetical protein